MYKKETVHKMNKISPIFTFFKESNLKSMLLKWFETQKSFLHRPSEQIDMLKAFEKRIIFNR